MFEIRKQAGIILRKISYGEADEIVTVLFEGDGVRRLFASSSRKSRKRFAGLIDVFANLEFQYTLGRGSLARLQKASEIQSQVKSRFWEKDLSVFSFFSYLAELICEFNPEEANADGLYSLWNEAAFFFQSHNFSTEVAAHFLARAFEIFGYAVTPEAPLKTIISHAHRILQKRTRAEEFLLELLG
jgi:DNA repair protein RecO